MYETWPRSSQREFEGFLERVDSISDVKVKINDLIGYVNRARQISDVEFLAIYQRLASADIRWLYKDVSDLPKAMKAAGFGKGVPEKIKQEHVLLRLMWTGLPKISGVAKPRALSEVLDRFPVWFGEERKLSGLSIDFGAQILNYVATLSAKVMDPERTPRVED